MADPQRIQYFQQLRATGQPLPAMQDPYWEMSIRRTPSGLFELGLVRDTSISAMNIPGGLVVACLCATVFVIMGYANAWDFPQGSDHYGTMVILIFGIIVGLLFCLPAKKMPNPEISQLPLRPGQAALVMLPKGRHAIDNIAKVWLVLRERIEQETQQGPIWLSTPLLMVPLTVNQTSSKFYSADLRIPEDGLHSFEAAGYQLQWCIQVELASGGIRFYKLMVVPPKLKAEDMKYFN